MKSRHQHRANADGGYNALEGLARQLFTVSGTFAGAWSGVLLTQREVIGPDTIPERGGLVSRKSFHPLQSLHEVADYSADWLHRSSPTRFVMRRVHLAAWLVMPSAQPFFFHAVNSTLHFIASLSVLVSQTEHAMELVECRKNLFAQKTNARAV